MVDVVPTRINGRWTLKLPRHRADRAEWSDPGWEVERLDSMHANLAPGDVVYDIGAEEGDLSALYASWVQGHRDYVFTAVMDDAGRLVERTHDPIGPAGGVVLFEPNPRVWPNIRAIFEANDLPRPFGCFVGFASDTTRDDGLLVVGDWPVAAAGSVIGDHGFKSLVESEGTIPSISLDDVAASGAVPRPTALTLDVEGSELRVMHGAETVLERDRPLVWVSVHPLMMQYDYRQVSEDLHRYMDNHRYRMHQLAIDHEVHWFYWPRERDVVLP